MLRFSCNFGFGQLQTKLNELFQGCIDLPEECVLPQDIDIVTSIFRDLNADFTTQVILTPTNEEALKWNEQILQLLPGETETYYSIDSVISDD